MHRLNGSHQPSVDEILASIRASIAEEAAVDITQTEPRYRFTPLHTPPANDEDGGEFELPSMFKPAPNGAPEKHTRLFGRLTDALKSAVPEHGFSAKITSVAEPVNGAARPAHAAVETSAPETPAPAAKASAHEEVKRQMVPFKDCLMSRMGEHASGTHTAPVAPAPVAAPVAVTPVAPAPSESLATGSWGTTFSQGRAPAHPSVPTYARPTAEFGTFVPGRFENGYSQPGEPMVQSPMTHNPGSPYAPHQHPMAHYQASMVPSQDQNYAHVPQQTGNPVDDAAAQLLRPMLRQWLSENMPKIVEKALLSEVTEGGPPSGNKNGHNH